MGAHKSLSPSEDSWEGFLEEVGQAEVAAVQWQRQPISTAHSPAMLLELHPETEFS